MSRIRPEELPKPKKVSKKRASELLATFSVSGTSKYDMYVAAALDLNPGESLEVIVLPENVITSIQKKFREQGLSRAKGYFVMSKSLGNEKAGQKSLLIGRYAKIPKATTSTSSKKTVSRTSSSRSTSKAATASRAKVARKRAAAKKTTTVAKATTSAKAASSSSRTAKPKKTTAPKRATTTRRATTAKRATAKKTTSAKKATKVEKTNRTAVAA